MDGWNIYAKSIGTGPWGSGLWGSIGSWSQSLPTMLPVTLKLTTKAPEDGWLEYLLVSFWETHIFRWELLVWGGSKDVSKRHAKGVWWGNSQIFALVAWMGQALAQQSWQAGCLPSTSLGHLFRSQKCMVLLIRNWDVFCWQGQHPYLDYYIYSSFTENPSNQCLIHSKEDCMNCLNSCVDAFAGGGSDLLGMGFGWCLFDMGVEPK